MRCFWSHADVSALLRDRRLGRAAAARAVADRLPAFASVERYSLLELEPPEHTALRRLVNRAFVSRSIAPLAPGIEKRAHELIDAILANGSPCDLLRSFATPIPVETIAGLLGVPTEDAPRLLAWSHAICAMYRTPRSEQAEAEAERAAAEFDAYLRKAIASRRGGASGGLLGAIVNGPDAPCDDEIVSTAILLLNAGHEATVHQIGNAVAAILTAAPDASERADWLGPERLEATIEETLRFDPPLHLFTRTAHEPIGWHCADGSEVRIDRGEEIGLLLGAANHDPRRYKRPDRFDPRRFEGTASPDHTSFGGGIHFCLGAPLARMELRIAIHVLFERLPGLALADEPRRANTYHFSGYESLPVRW